MGLVKNVSHSKIEFGTEFGLPSRIMIKISQIRSGLSYVLDAMIKSNYYIPFEFEYIENKVSKFYKTLL